MFFFLVLFFLVFLIFYYFSIDPEFLFSPHVSNYFLNDVIQGISDFLFDRKLHNVSLELIVW